MSAPVVHFEITGRDGDALKEYYSNLFGWQINSDNPMKYGMVSAGEGGIGGGVTQGEAPAVTIFVQVDNPQVYLDKAVRLGGKVVTDLTEVPGMVTFCTFADPEGNIIGIVKEDSPQG